MSQFYMLSYLRASNLNKMLRQTKECGHWRTVRPRRNKYSNLYAWFGMERKNEVEVFLVDVRKEMKDSKIHAYWPL